MSDDEMIVVEVMLLMCNVNGLILKRKRKLGLDLNLGEERL